MKINTNSWHYKLLRKTGCNKMPKDLCGYFWALVGRAVVGLVGLALLCALCMLIFITIATKGLILLFAVGIASLIAGIVFFITELEDSDNLFFSWLRARKQKICPIIEYVDKKK